MTRRLLVCLALLAFAAPEVITQTAQQPSGTGTITGTIVREGTNDPIPDVQIAISGRRGLTAQQAQLVVNAAARGGAAAGNIDPETLQDAQETIRVSQTPITAVTNSAGQFTLQNVPVGTTTVRAQLEGFFGTAVDGSYPPMAIESVVVSKDQTSTIKISLVPGGTINGRVLTPVGKPMTDGSIQVLRAGYQNGRPLLEPLDIKQTDDRGEFRLYRLPPGEYTIAAGPRPQALAALQGNVVESSEVAVPTFYPNVTDPSTATRINLRPGDEVNGINIQLRTVRSIKVTGRVTSAATPGGQGQTRPGGVMLVRKGSTGVLDFDIANTVPLGPDGGPFEFTNVVPGEYDLIARVNTARGAGWGPQVPPATATGPWALGRVSIDARNGNVDNVALVINPGIDVKGRVLLDGTPTRANVRLSLQSDDSYQDLLDQPLALVFNQIRLYSAPIADDGTFTIPLVPEGRYRIQPVLNPPSPARGATGTPPPTLPETVYLSDIRQGATSVYDNGVMVGGSEQSPIEVLLITGAGSLEGNVLGADQKPAGVATVVLVPPDNRRQNAALYKSIKSDAQGHFVLKNVPPGRYTLYAWESVITGAYQSAEFMARYNGRGTAITVSGARTTSNVSVIKKD
jgi:hypothetical protein